MSDEEPTITPSPYIGLNGQVKRSPITTTDAKQERTIAGGVDDERFKLSTLENIAEYTRLSALLMPQLVKFIWGLVMNNWKTTISASVVAVALILSHFGIVVPESWFEPIVAIGVAIVGMLAKDHNVTGGTKVQE